MHSHTRVQTRALLGAQNPVPQVSHLPGISLHPKCGLGPKRLSGPWLASYERSESCSGDRRWPALWYLCCRPPDSALAPNPPGPCPEFQLRGPPCRPPALLRKVFSLCGEPDYFYLDETITYSLQAIWETQAEPVRERPLTLPPCAQTNAVNTKNDTHSGLLETRFPMPGPSPRGAGTHCALVQSSPRASGPVL